MSNTSEKLDDHASIQSTLHQYVLPIHHPSAYAQEGSLRRKTPNGTIHAGYEGEAMTNPNKYQALPTGQKHTFAEHQRLRDQRTNKTWHWSSLQGSLPVMDSVLHQAPVQQYPQQIYHSIPSVVQPGLSHIGPTASGGHGNGPHGPYFYDGTYVPYRPAAVRDPRFYHFQPQQCQPWHAYQPSASTPLAPGWVQPWTGPAVIETFGPDQATHRDRVHAWALQQYRDLLSFIQHTRRQQQHARHMAGEPQITIRPSFYPKPPGLSPFTSPKWHRRSASSGQTNNELSSVNVDMAPATINQRIWSPSGIYLHDNEYQRRASHDEYRKSAVERRSSATTISPIVAQTPYDNSPPSRAVSALSHITKYCQAENWQWVDGMHLGGCLAYGLGNYDKALRWYNKVLEIEPGHLEVMSNLAATLLALGQKDEAEQYWTKVVRAAPNHFEAVEHLIGLLCNQNRSKDAVSIIEHVERTLQQDVHHHINNTHSNNNHYNNNNDEPGFASSGFAVPATDNGRVLALVHAKGNMLYTLGDNAGAARAFEDAVLIAVGSGFRDIRQIIDHVLTVVSTTIQIHRPDLRLPQNFTKEPILLTPEQALQTARFCFPPEGELPGLQHVPGHNRSLARRAILSTTSNSLLSLAKIYQDGLTNPAKKVDVRSDICGVRDILALYYLSLALQPSPSTANNVGILLAGVQQITPLAQSHPKLDVPGVIPGSGIALALQYYNYGLQLDQKHAHLYTNLGSLLKDIGQLDAAIAMYEQAVKCDTKFDIALANLANAVKDKGRISDAITYYKRAVDVNPNFAEAVCGLANALNSVCNWHGRGGLAVDGSRRDPWHVTEHGMLLDAKQLGASNAGWINRVVDIVKKQLEDGETWGMGVLTAATIDNLQQQIKHEDVTKLLISWADARWEGARVTRLIERVIRRIQWQWYHDLYILKKKLPAAAYSRPRLPTALTIPSAPTVLPFHTFTCPMSAKQIRQISQRNGLRISVCSLRAPWMSNITFTPPSPPAPFLRVGYISSDFNNHPLAHLMQSVFGLHDQRRVKAHCYATTPSDNSIHRRQIQSEAPVFHDASQWSSETLIKQIIADGIHILVNLNGYTRGARNEIFAARAAPLQMSFMGFAGTLGAEWCDYLLADETAVPISTLRPYRSNVSLDDVAVDDNHGCANDDWIYGENIIYCRDTFFCCDHKQSNASAKDKQLTWEDEQKQRWQMRKSLFPQLNDSTIIFGNFNQLYKIDPTTFRTWLRILAHVPNSILWLLRFPDLGESHLLATAKLWAGDDVASRVVFTDVAPKHLHISRARICDLVLDTAECNAHTTAADVLWSGTPLLTLPRYEYKMCSRIAASILKGALPKDAEGARAAKELIATSEEDYEEKAVILAKSFAYTSDKSGSATGRLMELRKMLYHCRWTSALFDTARWVRDLEDAYEEAWKRFVEGKGGDIYLDKI